MGVKGVCVVTDEGDGILEIKNIATDSHFHRKGYGRMLIKFIEETFPQSVFHPPGWYRRQSAYHSIL